MSGQVEHNLTRPTLLRISSFFLCFSLVVREANCCRSSGVGGVVMSRKCLKAW